MKKVLVTLVAALFAVGIASAQDLETATNLYNAAAEALNAGNKADAVPQFKAALETAVALGEDGAQIVNDCKDIIPKILLQLGKDQATEGVLDKAIEYFGQAIASAKEYENNEEVVAEAAGLISQMQMAEAGNLLNEKDYEGAVAAYKKVVEADPENGMAYLRMGMALSAGGDPDAAIEAFNTAIEKGQEDAAKKQLSNTYLKKSVACQKAKDTKGALENAQLSAEYNDNANAQKLIGLNALQLKQYAVAAPAFEAYLAMSPKAKDKAQIIYQLGTALQGAGDNAKACSYFKQIAQDEKWGEAARYQITVLKCN
ncbi:MAG: tetratricopeptide repeat protein [Bacteroidales bacterium]|nr:tetratricopeptide repeat protein [Bacteroidales bacterium]